MSGPAPTPQSLALGADSPGPSSAPRALTFADRVRAQEAIERLYYRHQIGATKPFEEAVSRAAIEAKVRRYLEESIALETLWKTPITDDALQRELERMAGGTRMPERLREIYAALGDDLFLIKECVARATLADRLTHNFYAYDPRFHSAARKAVDSIREQLVSGALSTKADHPNRTVVEIRVGSQAGSLTQTDFDRKRAQFAAVDQPTAVVESRDAFSFDVLLEQSPTSLRVATYVVSKIRWEDWWSSAGGSYRGQTIVPVASTSLNLPAPSGASAFDPNAPCTGDGWNNGVLDDLPQGRAEHTAVWTGSEMLVWGGADFANFGYYESGSRYDPVTDTWQRMTMTNAPRGRVGHTAVWTGSEMIVWGGYDQYSNSYYVSGGRYDPVADRWTRTSLGPSARISHSAVWTGTRMIVWGGYFEASNPPTYLKTGALYDPSTDSWTPTAALPAFFAGRYRHTAVWTGSEMIVWGGFVNGGFPSGDGRRYNPATNSWSPMTGTEARFDHAAVWTGTSLVVWGGRQYVPCPYCPNGGYTITQVNTGARYDPVRDFWIPMSVAGAPYMQSPLAAWTGHDVIVLRNERSTNDGARYDPSIDRWTAIATDTSSPAREEASLVWTGRYAIVWGGRASSPSFTVLNTGRRYDPWSDTWTPTSTSGPASQRISHSAVWSGNEMIVWGGRSSAQQPVYLDSGGRYDPGIDSWTEMTAHAAPSPRRGHAALWTGGEMLVWGGEGASGQLNSGGRYDPLNDAWRATSGVDAPSPRAHHATAWTGQRMVVWGGRNSSTVLGDGGVYDPATDRWKATTLVNAPSPRQDQTAIWSGNQVVIWGGSLGIQGDVATDTGGLYDPLNDTWSPTSITGAPSPRAFQTAVWAGGRMVVWGGGGDYSALDSGGRYDPVSDVWSATTTVGAPPPRGSHSAVAAGNRMIVWGGVLLYLGLPNTGGLYDVVADRWTKITKPGDPGLRNGTAVWTGEAMLTWTGNDGGRYFPGPSLDDDCDGDGVAADAGDCDDHDPSIHPGAEERCDGVGNDCGSLYWPWVPFVPPWEPADADRDRDGWLECGGDCDDNNVYRHPGQAEACDGFDTDCSGDDPLLTEADADGDGFRICQGDCNDANRYAHPGGSEYSCDGSDDDCDGLVDEGGDALCIFNHGCVTATCSGSQGCTNITQREEGPCDDGNPCTGNDSCNYNSHCEGTSDVPNGTACDDRNPCTLDDQCIDGQCSYTTREACGFDDSDCNGYEYCSDDTGQCTAANILSDCDDGNVCTDDSCDETGCHHVNNSAPCDDGNACTAGDVCAGGACLAGAPRTCDDGNPCTDDACAPWAGCTQTNREGACDDGNVCTGWDACSDGTCVGQDPVACPAADSCHTEGTCDPATGVCSGVAQPDGTECDDGELCTTDDRCVAGSCTPAGSGLAEPNPRANGYYTSLCRVPHSGDQLTDADAACVGTIARTFAGVATVADLCAELTPSQPNNDPCDRTEDDLMVLALNLCRGRTCTSQPIRSQCGQNKSVGASFDESDAALSRSSRDSAACAHVKCLDEEINTGRALEMNSLTLRGESGAVRLTWAPPYVGELGVRTIRYQVQRRVRGSLAPFTRIATTEATTFLDGNAGGNFEYDVTAIVD
jgi:N-acetylneuraminic acid mutarotase